LQLPLVFAWCCAAAAQTADLNQRLTAGQALRSHDHFAEALKVHLALPQDVQNIPNERRFTAVVLDNAGMDQENCGDYAAAETAFNLETAVACQGHGQVLWGFGFPTAARFT
jgi:hypothetical protein